MALIRDECQEICTLQIANMAVGEPNAWTHAPEKMDNRGC